MKHKIKHLHKTFKNKRKLYQKAKHKNAKPTIKDSSSVCYKNSQTREKKSHKNVNLCDKKPQTSEKESQKCKFMW